MPMVRAGLRTPTITCCLLRRSPIWKVLSGTAGPKYIYVNSGKTYLELESQGAYTELKPGESLSYTVRWYLMPVNSESITSQQLISKARALFN